MKKLHSINSISDDDEPATEEDEKLLSIHPTQDDSPHRPPPPTASKFASLLGFSLLDPPGSPHPSDTTPPANMGTLTLTDDPDSTQRSRSSSHRLSNPLEPSYFQIGLRMADTQWAMNYQEAAIYLEEGANNDRFSTHPKRRESLPAYILAHTRWAYILDLLASLLLLSLALVEPPAVISSIPAAVHASLELFSLLLVALGLLLKLRWLGAKNLVTHQRSLAKACALLIMFIEALVVLARQSSHFRVTRALRPIFLVDNRYCRGIRRFTREVLQSLPPILDMLLLLFFFILAFTLLGHFLFGHAPDDPFFGSVELSFVSLFVLLTTANYPDVMMAAYAKSRWASVFFAAYLVTVLYLFMNLLLAVVYDTFTSLEKDKFRKLVVHKRQATTYAFNLLVSKSHPQGILFRHFYGLLTQYAPKKSLRDIYLAFKALDRSGDGVLSREEFCRFYEVADLKWEPQVKEDGGQGPAKRRESSKFFLGLQRFLANPYSDHLFNGLIILNSVAMIARWVEGSTGHTSWDAGLFAALFSVEMVVKLVAWGSERVFSSGWHTFDVTSTVALVAACVIASLLPQWDELLTFVRPLRLLRLFKLKKRYRDVFGTLFILIPPMTSAASVILLIYYVFAIVGMEIFHGIPLANCCNGTLLEPYYAYVPLNTTSTAFAPRYYLNTFSDLASSWVTLFELTVVNNWYVIMEGHAAVTSAYARLFFMSFYLVTMVLMTIIVAFILDTFLFRIQYKRQMDKQTEERLLRTQVALTPHEIAFCFRHDSQAATRDALLRSCARGGGAKDELVAEASAGYSGGTVAYVGFRRRTKEILYKRMFRNEIPDWLREAQNEPLGGGGVGGAYPFPPTPTTSSS